MPHRDTVLHILRHTPEWVLTNGVVTDSRKRQLGMLAGGRPWRYMERHFFPSLRCSHLRVYTDRAADQFDGFVLGPYATAEVEPYAGIGSESSGDAVVWAVAAVVLAAVVAGLVLGRQD